MNSNSDQPWNKGRSVGARYALTIKEIAKIKTHLSQENSSHDLCLFMVALDTMLRASDLLQLRVSDVQLPNADIRQSFPWRQKKTSNTVHSVLTPSTQTVLRKWILKSGKRENHFLFTREKSTDEKPIASKNTQ